MYVCIYYSALVYSREIRIYEREEQSSFLKVSITKEEIHGFKDTAVKCLAKDILGFIHPLVLEKITCKFEKKSLGVTQMPYFL